MADGRRENLTSDGHRDALDAVYDATRALYLRLARANCVQLMELPARAVEGVDADARPVRIVWRASSDYLLRMMELLVPHFSSLTQAFVLLEIVRVNTEAMPDALRGDDRLNAEGAAPDAYRRPVRTSDIARRLKRPHETARRNLAALVEEGRCQQLRDGFIVPAGLLAGPNVMAAFAPNFQNLRRMLITLAETGIIAKWEAEHAGAETAA